jgi:hypothetical protein
MSIGAVRIALEGKLNAMTPSISTAWENVPFTPTPGTAYQAAYLLPVTENPTMGDDYYRIDGIFQVNLFYPLQTGAKAAQDRAELIKTAFRRGTTMTSGTVKVIVERTPDIGQGRVDGDRWMVPVKIRFYAEVF